MLQERLMQEGWPQEIMALPECVPVVDENEQVVWRGICTQVRMEKWRGRVGSGAGLDCSARG